MTVAKEIGIGLVGCGGAAHDVAEAIRSLPDARIAAAFDRNPQSAVTLTQQRGGAAVKTLEALLVHPEVDIVYVGLPHNLLAPTADQALNACKHVLVEKPMALDDAEVRRLGQIAAAKKLTLGVFFELREAETVRTARKLVQGGAIGAVRMVRIETIIDKPQTYWQSGPSGRTPDTWRAFKAQAGGGVVLMNSVHQIDSVRHITGLDFTRAMAETATLSASVEVEDSASAVLKLSNGGLVNLVANAHSHGARREEVIIIDGEFGRIEVSDAYSADAIRLFLRREWGDYAADAWINIAAPRRDSHAAMVAAFVDAVRTGNPAPATAADAAAALATVLAIYESAKTGTQVNVRI